MDLRVEKIKNILSMAQKAGKIVSGTFAVNEILNKGRAFLILVAEDASSNTEWQEKARLKGVESYKVLTKEILGHAIGKENIAIIAILDQGFAKALLERIRDFTS